MGYFFVSYLHEDSEFVTTLEDRLANAGILVWTDNSLRTGGEWKKQIDLQIQNSAGVILVITPISLVSPYVTYEWSFAKGSKKVVIPIVLKHISGELLHVVSQDSGEVLHSRKVELHPRLNDVQYIDFSTNPEKAWKKLVFDLKQILQEDIPSDLQTYWDDLNSSDDKRRENAIKTLESYQDDKASDVLARAIAETKLPDVKRQCGFALARRNSQDTRAIPALRDVVLHDNGSDTYSALNYLENLNHPESADVILLVLKNNTNNLLRGKAASALGKLKYKEAADALLDSFSNDTNWDVKFAAGQALAKIQDNRTVDRIKQIVDPWVTSSAPLMTENFRQLMAILIRFGDDGIRTTVNLLCRNNIPNNAWNSILQETLNVNKGVQEIAIYYVNEKFNSLPPGAEKDFWQNVRRAFGIWG